MQVADLFAKLSLKPDKSSFSAGDRLIRGIKGALIGLGVFQGVRFLKGVIAETIELGDNLGKLSAQLGVGTSALQELEFAAAKSDVEFSELTTGLKFLSKNAFEALQGNQALRKSFKSLGVSATELKKKSPDELLASVADAFQRMPAGERVGRALEVFGKQGATLVPLLSKGRAGIEDLRKEAARLGFILTPDQVKQLEEADDQIKDFKFSLRGVTSQLALNLLPIVREYLEKLQVWIRDNRELIALRVKQFIEGLTRAIELAGDALDFLSEHSTATKVALGVLAAAFLATKVAAVAAAVATLAAWAPVAAAVAAVGLAVHEISAAIAGEEGLLDFIHEPLADAAVAVEDFFTPEDRAGERRLQLSRTDPVEFLRRQERDRQRADAAQAMRRGQSNKASFPALYPQAAADAKAASTTTNNTTNANITVNSPNADPRMIAAEITRKLEEAARATAAATQ